MSCLIILEGNIGSGKSTFSEKVGEMLNFKVFKEPVEENPYLSKFYKDPKRWALEMQFYLMSHRYQQHQEAINHIWRTGQGAIMDRSIFGDAVFAKKNFIDGNIDEEGYANYMKMREAMTQHLMIPQVTIYLDVEPETCQKRISQRNRNCEQTIPIDYLNGLNSLYLDLLNELESKGSRIAKLNWNTFVPFSDVVGMLQKERFLPKPFEQYPHIS